ncbi:16S rRNA (guanine(966)-N(2))-methyltransferase RsmD [Actinomyces vulturis]|uniref:16S rRNA (guanine(966)-N(2))-methyltransferase RsmD n=1 Tax=Actinomyces vulturis TaxID=1857645 RepID=UPI000834EF4B|nr:16S rRNA (guanine(966)-N(2))-methyltransferase RsmD [Actinomyces vulturis]
MTRIVAGSAGGLRLTVPSQGTRPTSERVREALFSRLEHDEVLAGARVLDLFAGSGALGLEAASRGAGEVTLVDLSRQAVGVMERNIATVSKALPKVRMRAVCGNVAVFVSQGATPMDLVFLDPPYDVTSDELDLIIATVAAQWLAPNGTIIVERSSRSAPPVWPKILKELKSKKYGETALYLAYLPVD